MTSEVHRTPPPDVLTKDDAEERAQAVREVAYDLTLELERNAPGYRGEAVVRFRTTSDHGAASSGRLFLDFKGRQIDRLTVDGEIAQPEWTSTRLTLPVLAAGPHEILIAYENDYDHVGEGLHRFVDPEDGSEYLYSHFEPFAAHRLFPCFDQPDIKATYRMTVVAPDDWQVIANSPKVGREQTEDARVAHHFAEAGPFSTYLVALVAGRFHVVRDDSSGVPLAAYARQSLARVLDEEAAEIFEITRQGLAFYADLFDRPYPFEKYDQLFVPEFNSGAMENVGAVTFRDQFVFRDPPTEHQRLERAEVILHELAHMWFGNLVTMRWWDDLWLNESFATYISYLALAEATRFRTAWLDFTSLKRWAYRQDQLPTTHPIADDVADTEVSLLNFDGITYAKGAATIKQLVAAIGPDGFREGMRQYFRRHAHGNATLRDFLAALEAGSGRHLTGWAQLWLETPSLNTLGAEWRADNGRLAELRLVQTAPDDWPTLRPHTVEIGLARVEGGRLVVDSLPARIEGPVATVDGAAGRPRPSFVFPNHEDLTYAKVRLDPQSVDFLRTEFARVEDPLLRQLLWMALWEMVRDRQLTSLEYLEIARRELPREINLQILDATLLAVAIAARRYVPEQRREAEAHALVQTAWRSLMAAPSGDSQIIWARSLIGLATTAGDLGLTIRLADEPDLVPGLTVDQEMRWSIAVKAVALGLDGARERIEAERRRDPSDRGDREAIRADAARPDQTSKAETWQRIAADAYGSLYRANAAMSGFNWPFQRDLLDPYVERFFDSLPEVVESQDHQFVMSYVTLLFPSYRGERSVLERAQRCLDEHGSKSTLLRRLLLEAIDELDRAIACREYAAAFIA